MLVCALAVLTLGCQTAAATPCQPTAEEAHRFVEAAEKRLETLGKKASRAGVGPEQFHHSRHADRSPPTRRATSPPPSRSSRCGARRFEGLQLPDEDARKLKLLKLQLAAPAPDNPAERDELSSLVEPRSKGNTAKASTAAAPAAKQECLDIDQASEHSCVEPRPERARSTCGRDGIASARRCASLQPIRRALQQGRARARLRRYGRAVALELRHAARRVCRRGRSSLDAGAAALLLPAHLRAIEARREIRRRRASGERHDSGASPRQHVGAGLEQHLSAGRRTGVR